LNFNSWCEVPCLKENLLPMWLAKKNLYVYKRTWAFQFLTAQVNHHETD
jgi:hypothetical protein